MSYCEDYPTCGHGPVSTGGDDGGCPDSNGRYKCVLCGKRMRAGVTSSICSRCRARPVERDDLGMSAQDRYDEEWSR